MIPNTVNIRLSNLVVLAGPATTLAISPWFNYDPINLIKVLTLTCISFAAFGLIVPHMPKALEIVGKNRSIIIMFFTFALFSSFFFSGANKSQQFWGVFGRNTGVLSYLALLAIFFVTATIGSQVTYLRVTWSLVVTVAIMSAYCLVQIANLDPIGWSAYFPFGTLGNVNFLSGFMGLGLVTVFIYAFSTQFTNQIRMWLATLFVTGLFVLVKSDSTQGVVALVAGIATFLLIRLWYVHRVLFGIAFIVYLLSFFSLVLGLFDRGPLSGLIYQFTVLYRADYMHAGIAMLLRHPLTGVGIDSFDDWYRAERGIISALRTSLNRTANSAHNVSIDLGAGGGFPLLIAYFLILGVIVLAILTGLRRGLAKDPIFMALSMSWFAYQVQASVSINQIGVGVWGWILGGALLGYSNIDDTSTKENLKKLKFKKLIAIGKKQRISPNTPPPLSVVSSVTLLAIGFTLAFIPLKTDADFARASKLGSAQLLVEATMSVSSNTFMLQKSSLDAFQSNLPDIAKSINDNLKSRFPRNIGGWISTYENSSYTPMERSQALDVISELDPYLALCYIREPELAFRERLDALPPIEKYRLALGWGLTKELSNREAGVFSFFRLPSDALLSRINSFCRY